MYKAIVIILLLFILLSTCIGCTSFDILKKKTIIKPKPEKKEFICTKIDCGDEDINKMVEEEKKQNIIACIKVQPDCEW